MKWGISVCCARRFHCLIDKDEGNNWVDQPFKLESFLRGLEINHLNCLYSCKCFLLCLALDLGNCIKTNKKSIITNILKCPIQNDFFIYLFLIYFFLLLKQPVVAEHSKMWHLSLGKKISYLTLIQSPPKKINTQFVGSFMCLERTNTA